MKNLEKLVKNNRKQIRLIGDMLSKIKESGERFEAILYLMENGIVLPGKYVEKAYSEAVECPFFDKKDYKETGDAFKTAGFKSLAYGLYHYRD